MISKKKAVKVVLKTLNCAALLAVGMIFFIPFFWMVSTAFKTLGEAIMVPPRWIPNALQWQNFTAAWNSGPFAKYILNSVVVTFGIILLQFCFAIPAAYAYARIDFKGKNLFFGITMITMMIPSQLIFLPIYLLMSDWNMINTYWALILPFAGSAFTIFLLRQSFMQIPQEIIDSARMDNANELQVIGYIMIPLAKSSIVTAGLFSFISHWNDYFWPLIMTTNNAVRTLPIGIAQLRDVEAGVAWNVLMAGNVILVLPILIVFFMAQRQIIRAFVYSSK